MPSIGSAVALSLGKRLSVGRERDAGGWQVRRPAHRNLHRRERRRDRYARLLRHYAEQHDKPLAIVETAALYNTTETGADELDLKQAWWQQVFAPEVFERFPRLRMINWFEWGKPESEIGGDRIDWTSPRTPRSSPRSSPTSRAITYGSHRSRIERYRELGGGGGEGGMRLSRLRAARSRRSS